MNKVKEYLKRYKGLYSVLKGVKTAFMSLCFFLCDSLVYFLILPKFIFSEFTFCKQFKTTSINKLWLTNNRGGGTGAYLKNVLSGEKEYSVLKRINLKGACFHYYVFEASALDRPLFLRPKYFKRVLLTVSQEVHVVSFLNYRHLADIFKIIESISANVVYDVHDFHCVCPSVNLRRGEIFCDFTTCDECVFKIDGNVVHNKEYRNIWRPLLNKVKTIRCFSKSSKELVSRAYPEFSDKIIVEPHSMEYFKTEKISYTPSEFVVGIFGSVSSGTKGKKIVSSFLHYAEGKNIKVCVNGSLSPEDKKFAEESRNIYYYGRYKNFEIQKLLTDQKISAVFFPTACPETFSFTISELILTEIPIACFNVGAQADKISEYKFGKIIPKIGNESIEDSLRAASKLRWS